MGHFLSQPDHPVPNSARSNTVTPPPHPVLTSDHAHQTTSDSPAVSDSAPIESSPPSLSPPSSPLHPVSQPSHPLPHSTPTLSPAQPSRTPQPAVFYVPRNSRQIVLDFSDDSLTPESKAKHALLSDNPNNNAIALVGMGGAGKTTILRALGRHPDVWQKFPDGVWFIELCHDAKVQRLFDQLEQIVTDAFPDFLPKFVELTAKENTHSNMMEKLVDLLGPKRFLLIFDDVWDLDPTVYKLVDTACKGVQEMDGGSCKVLTSTRNEAIGRVPTHDVSIGVSPGDVRRETCIAILCGYAGIDCTRLVSFLLASREWIFR